MEKSNSEKDNCAYKKFLEEGTTKFYQNDFIGAIDALNRAHDIEDKAVYDAWDEYNKNYN